jgi:hypothetical protein
VLNSQWHLLSVLEALYVIGMFCYFRTKCNVAINDQPFGIDWLWHPITTTQGDEEARNLVCRLGHILAFLLAGWLVGREGLRQVSGTITQWANLVVMGAALAGSMLNLNVTLYLAPVFFAEAVAARYLPQESSTKYG